MHTYNQKKKCFRENMQRSQMLKHLYSTPVLVGTQRNSTAFARERLTKLVHFLSSFPHKMMCVASKYTHHKISLNDLLYKSDPVYFLLIMFTIISLYPIKLIT